MTTTYWRGLGHIVFLFLFIYSVSGSFTSASSPPVISPAAETELICHTDNPAECYPKVFSPTEEFQVVHDDQDLPPGLHVQLDVQTGRKQAKLYNPDEENPALAGLPVNQEVIIVDPEAPQENEPSIPAGAPAYEPVGMVKAPREKNEGFSQALQTIRKTCARWQSIDSSTLNEALQLLDDLSHDMYYGLQIAEDTESVRSLFCLLSYKDKTEGDEQPFAQRADFLASSILSAAVGNNARALAAIEKSWPDITEKQCKGGSHSIKHELFHRLAPTSEPGTKQESEEAETTRVYLAVISGLLKSPKIRAEFLENNGMQNFLQILLRDNDGVWESRKAKVARIVSDTFLDEDFGATPGLWPKKQQIDAGNCAESGPQSFGDECWEYHLKKISQGNGAPDWSQQLLSLIKRTQTPSPGSETPSRHSEL
ncbi:nucleotide exchange factor SIL1 [Xylaria flabelliformis]|nr:nucleotide exchange factor SIL1 [Xylaria flabelliformis]